jgi:cytochrome c5
MRLLTAGFLLAFAGLAGAQQPGERSGKQVVDTQCAKCHLEGKGGAPKIGDRDAWTQRLKKGLDNTVREAIKGHGGMPARGDKADLTDSEVRSAILYMFNPGGAAQK